MSATTFVLTNLLGLILGLIGARCELTLGARTWGQLSQALLQTSQTRPVWFAMCLLGAALGTLLAIIYAMVRGSAWGLLVALAALAARLATAMAMDGRPIRIHRTAGGRA